VKILVPFVKKKKKKKKEPPPNTKALDKGNRGTWTSPCAALGSRSLRSDTEELA
jgi:hypothetical protein